MANLGRQTDKHGKMIDKEEIERWLKLGLHVCGMGLCLSEPCAICKGQIRRGDYYFSHEKERAHMNCILSEEVLQQLEIEHGERNPNE